MLRLLCFGVEAVVMTTAVAEARAKDAGDVALGVVSEDVRELCLALDALTCVFAKITKTTILSRKRNDLLRVSLFR